MKTKENMKLMKLPFCLISNNSKMDTPFVYFIKLSFLVGILYDKNEPGANPVLVLTQPVMNLYEQSHNDN